VAARARIIRVGDTTWNARLKYYDPADLALAVMARAAVVTLAIRFRVYAGYVRLHCKTNVDTAYTARELCAVPN
jgi:hypothetical protein